ncbi:chloride channel protein [Reyranella sp.]|uniref:chloride channel protein n=1 Tax=Reyranella sp. TaxID=1929291 RepID=UPI003D0C6336
MDIRLSALGQARRFLLLQGRLRSNEPTQIFVCAVFGALVGALISGLHKLVDLVHALAFNLSGTFTLSTGIGVDPMRILIVPAAGGLVLGIGVVVMRRLRPTEVVDPIEANALHGGRMSMTDSLRLLIATFWSNASGVAVGMEAGYSQLGAAILAKVGQYFRLRRPDQRIFVGAGAGAAIAAAFDAPLAGAFYAFELIIGGYSVRALAPVAAATLSATLVERAIVHPTALFFVGPFPAIPSWFYLMFALLGAAAAGYSVLAMQSVTWAERLLRRLPLPQWLRPAIGGALVAAMALVVPQVLGSGHGAIQELFDRDLGLIFLLVLLVTKLVASAISLGSGFRGGMFSSSLLLGCLFGAVFGQLLTLIAPGLAGQQAVLMLVGMASVAAAVIGSPLTMVFLVLEGTDNFPVTVGVMAGVVVASTIVRLAFGYSFSTWRFHQRGIGIRSAHDIGWLADLTVSRLMRTDAKTVPETTPLAELRERFPPGSTKRAFVVSESGEYAGSLDVAALYDEMPSDLATQTARNFAKEGDLYLLSYENVRTALARFEDKEVESLPVLESPTDKKVIGYLSEQYALRRYNQELERRRTAELGERDLFSTGEPPR